MQKKNKRRALIFLLGALAFGGDRFLKHLARQGFFTSGKWLGFYPNYGLAFGLPCSWQKQLFLSVFFLIFLSVAFFYLRKKNSRFLEAAFFFFFVGALSNFWDRIAYGYVVDYFRFFSISYFNLADVCLTISLLLFLLSQKSG